MAQKGSDVQKTVHPLMAGEISCINSWKKWKELWQGTEYAELRHSLLHFGFAVQADSTDEVIERVCLYLDIADGWKYSRNFKKGEEDYSYLFGTVFGSEVNNLPEFRRFLAQKAFQSLCQNFFKNTAAKDYYVPSWARMATEHQVLEKILWFFRLNEDVVDIPNLDPFDSTDHNMEIATKFIRDLCEFAWTCENNRWGRGEVYEEMKDELRKARPEMIRLLSGIGALDVLLNTGEYQLDKSCVKQLENIAMAYDRWLPSATSWSNEHRKPRTLEEACFGNSQAARVLLILRVKQAEQKRFDAIRELEEQRREAEKKIEGLKK